MKKKMENNWIDIRQEQPKINKETHFSDNVWATDGENLLIVNYFFDGKEYHIANCYDDFFGSGEFEGDCKITHWQKMIIPEIPKKS